MTVSWNKYSFYHIHKLPPPLHQNKPLRESIFCDKVSTWWIKRALIMLKCVLKNWQRIELTSWQVGERVGPRVGEFVSWRSLWAYEFVSWQCLSSTSCKAFGLTLEPKSFIRACADFVCCWASCLSYYWRRGEQRQENKAVELPISRRKTNRKRWKQPKIFDKRPNEPIRF